MPGLQTTLNAVAASAGNSLIPALPSFATPLIWAYFGGSLVNSQNMPVGSTPLTNINAGPNYPVGLSSSYGAGYATFTPNLTAGSQLALSGPNDVGTGSITGIIVARTITTSGIQGLLSSQGVDNRGAKLFGFQPSLNQVQTFIAGAAATAALTISQGLGSFAMYAVSHTDGAASTVLYDLTHGVQADPVGTTSPRLVSATPAWSIGTAQNLGSQSGLSDIAFAAVIPGALNLATLQGIYASVKASLGLRGVVI